MTDPEARVMKGPDGGYRPSYNVQLATDVETQCVVAVSVTHQGNDQGLLEPMLDRLRQRYGRCPPEILADGAFAPVDGIQAAAESHSVLYAPVKPPKNPRNDPYRPRRSDSPPVAEWRARMASAEGKAIYKQRAATAGQRPGAQSRTPAVHGARVAQGESHRVLACACSSPLADDQPEPPRSLGHLTTHRRASCHRAGHPMSLVHTKPTDRLDHWSPYADNLPHEAIETE
jgi:hypothetical protein